MSEASNQRIEIYDTTLRDGTQGEGIAFSLVDKIKILKHLDQIGVDYVEGGFPLSNPKDEAFFKAASEEKGLNTRVCAFGMTRRRGVKASEDPGMLALVGSKAPVITIVGKTWDLHVHEVLRVSREENLDMIRESIAFCSESAEVFYDAEHFFDGYKANREYTLQTLKAALDGGATRLVLCDTNGGSLPEWVREVVKDIRSQFPEAHLGIHPHNDSGLATANALAAVEAGAVQVQGTINGIGERCGNVDLLTVAANLQLKMPYYCLDSDENKKNCQGVLRLTETSRFVYELANLNLISGQPYVGTGAFAHKGGMHVHAVQRVAHSYEHIPPESVGNTRRVLVSELSGASNIAATLGKKFNIEDDKQVQRKVLERIQDLENEGYQFEAADASFELLLHEIMDNRPNYFELDHYRCVIYRPQEGEMTTEGIVKAKVGDQIEHRVAEGDGPVNALDGALRKCLKDHYPQIDELHLTDYKVRVVNPKAESAAKVRVIAEFVTKDSEGNIMSDFATIGVNENIVDASWQALSDAFTFHLMPNRTNESPSK